MAQDYDNIGKKLWADHAEELSRFVLDTDDVEVLTDLGTEQQIIERETDIIKWIRINGHEAILHVELQLRDSTDTPMWARNAQYQGYLVGKYQMPVYSNVIYFHPRAGRNDPGGYTYTWNDYEHTNRYKVIRLIEIDGQAVLEMQTPGLLPFTPLMKPPTGIDIERWVQACVTATRAAPVGQETQADLLYGISVFGGIVYNAELLDRLIPEELMLESKTYQRQMEKAARATTLKNTLTVLNRKFPAEAVNALAREMQNIEDLQRLEQLLIAAAEARNLDTFTQILHESEPVGRQQAVN